MYGPCIHTYVCVYYIMCVCFCRGVRQKELVVEDAQREQEELEANRPSNLAFFDDSGYKPNDYDDASDDDSAEPEAQLKE